MEEWPIRMRTMRSLCHSKGPRHVLRYFCGDGVVGHGYNVDPTPTNKGGNQRRRAQRAHASGDKQKRSPEAIPVQLCQNEALLQK